jgi:hypothetical protein
MLILVNRADDSAYDSAYVTAKELANHRQVVLVHRDDAGEVVVDVLKDDMGEITFLDVTPTS